MHLETTTGTHLKGPLRRHRPSPSQRAPAGRPPPGPEAAGPAGAAAPAALTVCYAMSLSHRVGPGPRPRLILLRQAQTLIIAIIVTIWTRNQAVEMF